MKTSLGSTGRFVYFLNSIALLSICATSQLQGRDIESYNVAKARFYMQTNAGTPVVIGGAEISGAHEDGPSPFMFFSDVDGMMHGSISNATLRTPAGVTHTMEVDDWEHDEASFQQGFASESAFNTAFGAGVYTFTVQTKTQGTKTLTVNLPAGSYPVIPHVSNYAAAQAVNPNNTFRLMWDAFTGGTTNDWIQISVEDPSATNNSEAFGTSEPLESDSLNGTRTYIDLPAGTLGPGKTYFGMVIFGKVPVKGTTPTGEKNWSGYGSVTRFELKTTGTPDTTPPQLLSSTLNNGAVAVSFSERMKTNNWSFGVWSWNGTTNVNLPASNYRWSSDMRTMYYNVNVSPGTYISMGLHGLTDTSGNQLSTNSYVSLMAIGASISPYGYALVNSKLTCNANPNWVQFQWQRNGTNIAGATMSTYTPATPGSYRAIAKHSYPGQPMFSSATTGNTAVLYTNQTKQIHLQNTDGSLATWFYYGTNFVTSSAITRKIESGWLMAGQADFNKDGQTDLLWQKGTNVINWILNGTTFVRTNKVFYTPGSGALIASSKDFNADGQSDFLQHNSANNTVNLVRMTNSSRNLLNMSALRNGPAGWKPVVVGDFASDIKDDIVWQNTVGTNRQAKVWYGSNFVSETNMFGGMIIPAGWNIVGAVDLTGDGQKDLLLQNSTVNVQLWIMNRNMRTKAIALRNTAAAGWRVVGPK